MIRLGLTGSIGMGKSTTAAMFAQQGVPVHDSDAAVHELYRGQAAPLIEAAFPGTVEDGVVDRQRLSDHVLGNTDAIAKLEAIVHPLVAQAEQRFLEKAQAENAPLVVLDIPLLFEIGATDRVDKVLVVTAPADVQRERVLARESMTKAKFEAIIAKQMPDAQKRAQADFLIDTALGMDCARAKVRDLIDVLAPIAEPAAAEA